MLFAAAISLMSLAGSISQAAETGTFSVTLVGLPAGTLSYSANESGGQYRLAGRVKSSALARAIVPVSIETSARGRVKGNRYRPSTFREQTQRGGEEITTVFSYKNGAPQITRTPPRDKAPKYGLDPATQSGTLDPLTTAYAMLRDRPKDLACKLDIVLFDGIRRASILYKDPAPGPKGGLVCQGEYRRLAGFSPKELAEKPVWPFTIYYEPAGGQLRVVELKVPTTFGTVRIRRR
ncbi:MAG: DUF3108 domain-containing protein [Mangrovicoccus sp.]